MYHGGVLAVDRRERQDPAPTPAAFSKGQSTLLRFPKLAQLPNLAARGLSQHTLASSIPGNATPPIGGELPQARYGFSVPDNEDLRALAVVTLQLVAVLFIIYRFQIESVTFFRVMLLGAAGFVVHALLPITLRLPFFVGLSLAAIVVALGPADGLAVILLGSAMIGICHLPIRMVLRVAVLFAVAALFVLWRTDRLPQPWSLAVWPVLGSMFMFRLALYLHALAHDKKPATPAWTLAYFFMLPNVCFPLFPVVDYATFRRTYYDQDAGSTYATGMKWIVRGLIHLILYRLVYQHMPSDPLELSSLSELVQFVIATFLLYLRVSGQFHLITGVLHLFGFRLPETHHLYYLASSFTDFWRRINIYWKDFMMKLVYYPSFFRLRRLGTNTALVSATIAVFAATWLLHSYQWFWLRGGFPLAPQDGAFWGVLGALVVIGALREMRRPTARPNTRATGRRQAWSASLALRTTATFIVICTLWSLWSAESIMEWLLMWKAAAKVAPGDVVFVGGLVIAGFAISGYSWRGSDERGEALPIYRRPAIVSSALLVGLIALASRDLYSAAFPRLATTVAALQSQSLNARDKGLQHKGYYENLDSTSRMSAQLWSVQAHKPADWIPLVDTPAHHPRSDFLGYDLQPNAHITFLGQPFSTNALGFRGREYSKEKPPGVFRIAVLGPSHVMGSGVADADTFPALLEARLNQPAGAQPGMRYEVLNFGVAGFALTQQLAMLEGRVLAFHPDVVMFTDSPLLATSVTGHMLEVLAARQTIPFAPLSAAVAATRAAAVADDGIGVPFDSVRSVFRAVGLRTRMPWLEAQSRLRGASNDLVRITLTLLADATRAGGAVPVFVGLDVIAPPPATPVPALRQATDAGMLAFDLYGLWDRPDALDLRIATFDNHPNAKGDQLIADTLYALMQQHREELRLRENAGAAGGSGTSPAPAAANKPTGSS
jgi:D-alanyl-lipoteichoic acid acyltransferase DltB (MBOAT superfamily)